MVSNPNNKITWSNYCRRDEILAMWQTCRQNNFTHQDLVNKIHERVNSNNPNWNGSLPTSKDVKEICTQIRNGLLRQLAKYEEKAHSSKGSEFERNMAAKAKARIPTLLPGSGGTRARYDNMFDDMLMQLADGTEE
jgi:hypothetical protein